MRTMRELLNLFVDGEITTPKQAWELVQAEAPGNGQPALALAEEIVKTATRLLPPKRAEQIQQLFTDDGESD